MAIKTDILGMVHEYPDYFVVGREKIREYAERDQGRGPGAATTRRPPPNSVTTRWSRR